MGLLEDIVFCAPTLPAQLGAVLLHCLLWLVIGDWERGGMSAIYAMAKNWSSYKTVFAENYKGDPSLEMYGLESEPGKLWPLNFYTMMHHGTGGALMLAGIWTDQPWLFRHGMLVEVGGMDLLDFLKMTYCKIFPPGPFPTRNYFQGPKPVWPFLVFHHMVGLTVGLPVNLYFSDQRDFQVFGLIILGFPVTFVVVDLCSRFVPAKYAMAHETIEFINSCNFTWQRLIYYFPALYGLLLRVWSAPIPMAVLVLFFIGATCMTMFNLLVLPILWAGFYHKYVSPSKEKRAEGAQLMRTASALNAQSMAVLGRTFTSRFAHKEWTKARSALKMGVFKSHGEKNN